MRNGTVGVSGNGGDAVAVGAPLVTFAAASGNGGKPKAAPPPAPAKEERHDAGTVVGQMSEASAEGKVQAAGGGRARRWMTPVDPAFATALLLPAQLPTD